MAKKSTVGGPKARRQSAEDLERRQQYLSRAERDQRNQRWAVRIISGLIALSVIILLFALFWEQIWQPRQTILTVNGTEVSTGDYQDYVRFRRWQTAEQIRNFYNITGGNLEMFGEEYSQQISSMITSLRTPTVLGLEALDELEESLLIEQKAKELGLEVDDAAIDAKVEEYMAQRVGLNAPSAPTATPTLEPTITPTPLVSPTPTNTPLPTNTPTTVPTEEGAPTATPTQETTPTATFTPTATLANDEVQATIDAHQDEYFDTAKDDADVSRDTVRKVFYYEALREAVAEYMGQDVARDELQVELSHILISFDPESQGIPPTDEQKAAALERANEVMAALQSGEPFADLAKAVSDDPGSASSGGYYTWTNPDNWVDAFRDAALNSTVGEIVGPIETEYGYHIMQVHGREIRPLSDSELQSKRDQIFSDWLTEQKASAEVSRRDDWRDRVPNDPSYNSLLGDILPAQ